jgi:hypothetical protein
VPEPQAAATAPAPAKEGEETVPRSKASIEIRRYLSQSIAARKPVGYHRQFLDSYRPNVTFYLSEAQRTHLAKVGTPNFADQAAGTYAKQILNRRLIDLSWNSSRLEGNTDSLLDTSTRNNNIYAQLKLVYTQLNCQVLAKSRIAPVRLARAAGAQRRLNFVGTKFRAGGQGHESQGL